MRTVTYTAFRNNLKENIRRIRDDADVLLVANKDEEDNVVVMNARDYDSLMETLRIYSNPYLHGKILDGMKELDEGRGTARELIDA